MAASMWVEEESGSYSGGVHPHNGCDAADVGSLYKGTPPTCVSARGCSS